MTDFSHLAGRLVAGRYQVRRLVASGGMGAVYEGVHKDTLRRVAVKVMHPEIVQDPEARARFAQEAQVASLIDSPYVVDVLDAGVEDGMPYLVMEYLVGEELGDLLERRGRLPAVEAVPLLVLVGRALDRAHGRGVVHRDLKPENLFVAVREGERPTVKILDFGIAKMLQAASTSGSTRATGTPLYMAPEQTSRSSNIGPHTDIWALGLIAYTCLVGRPYWEGRDVHQLFAEILMSELESPIARASRAGVALPPNFDPWFFACVCRDPAGRYRSAGDAMTNLAYIFGLDPASIEVPNLDVRAVTPPPVSAIAATEMIAPTTPQLSAQPTPAAISYTPATPVFPANRSVPNVTPYGPNVVVPEAPQAPTPPQRSSGTTGGILGAAVIVAASLIGLAFYLKPSGGGGKKPAAAEKAKEKEKEKDKDKDKPEAALGPAQLKKQLAVINPFRESAGISLHEHEVTVDEYAIYLRSLGEAARKKARPLSEWTGEKVSPDAAKRPVVWVTWEQASSYCKTIDARLPTSVEWGAAVGHVYPWGDSWATKSQLEGVALGKGEGAKLAEVETSPIDRTEDGIYDLAGNVQEWTATTSDGLASLRGGAIHMKPDEAMPAISSGATKFTEQGAGEGAKPEAVSSPHLGFRCAK